MVFGRELLSYANDIGNGTSEWKVKGFIDVMLDALMN